MALEIATRVHIGCYNMKLSERDLCLNESPNCLCVTIVTGEVFPPTPASIAASDV
jgi:hypothetical protein